MAPLRLLFLPLLLASAFGQQTADAIMAKVAANQDQSEAERAHYVYLQHARVSSRKGKTVRCEEVTDTRITPTPDGYSQKLLKLDGRLLVKRNYVVYDHLPEDKNRHAAGAEQDQGDLNISISNDDSMDRDLVETMRDDLTRTKSKDGIGAGLFPLTSKAQANYRFQLVGQEKMNGRDVFHITFVPKDKDDYGWKGDAYIDRTAYQPVVVRTAMSRKIPFAVRTLLGTSLPNLGFTVTYAPEPSDVPGSVWFPVSFGTEFKLHVLFFFSREIVLSAENRAFEKTHVTSTILPTN